MKGRLLVIPSLFIVFLALSCKKESHPSIVGNWAAEAIYGETANGNMGWNRPGLGFILTLTNDGKFGLLTDVPEGHGTYTYDRSTGAITLTYLPSNSTSVLQAAELTMENLTLLGLSGPNSKMKMVRFE